MAALVTVNGEGDGVVSWDDDRMMVRMLFIMMVMVLVMLCGGEDVVG